LHSGKRSEKFLKNEEGAPFVIPHSELLKYLLLHLGHQVGVNGRLQLPCPYHHSMGTSPPRWGVMSK
ncbi:hypothetical protein CLOM_g9458, partial [Closterium sp. NIES-68]